MLHLKTAYTREMDDLNAAVEVRSSLVNFSQGSTRRTDLKKAEEWVVGRSDFDLTTREERTELFAKSWPRSA